MDNITKNFKKLDKIYENKYILQKRKQELEELSETNEELREYIHILEELDKYDKKTEKLIKGDLYYNFIEENLDLLEGNFVTVTIKKPYFRRTFNTEKFISKYPEGSNMYKDYFYDKEIKGSLILEAFYNDKELNKKKKKIKKK